MPTATCAYSSDGRSLEGVVALTDAYHSWCGVQVRVTGQVTLALKAINNIMATVKILVTSPDTRSERTYSLDLTVGGLKVRAFQLFQGFDHERRSNRGNYSP